MFSPNNIHSRYVWINDDNVNVRMQSSGYVWINNDNVLMDKLALTGSAGIHLD